MNAEGHTKYRLMRLAPASIINIQKIQRHVRVLVVKNPPGIYISASYAQEVTTAHQYMVLVPDQ
jgi:hypothetical protein